MAEKIREKSEADTETDERTPVYRIAAVSSDGLRIDGSFGSAQEFLVFAVSEDGSFSLEERRSVRGADHPEPGKAAGCASSCGGGGCGSGGHDVKIQVIDDCRALLCVKVGFQARKALEKRGIVVFDLDIAIEEALKRITGYFYRVDHHQSLAGFRVDKINNMS